MAPDTLLSVEDLHLAVSHMPEARILRGVSFDVTRGKTLAIVGESGCGKSVTSLAVMGLLPEGLTKTAGHIRFDGTDLPVTDNEAMRKIRGRRIGMVFQEPMAALNPVYTIGNQVAEVILEHEDITRAEARQRVIALMREVGLPGPEHIVDEYPHRLSGGQRQRVVIAMALACNPDLLIADEPTTALDVTVQAQIMRLLKGAQAELGVAIVLITHNLGLVAQVADRVAVMYAGRKVEEAATRRLFSAPLHPYTRGLLAATPRPGRRQEGELPLSEIPGMVPAVTEDLRGCRFAPRCPLASEICHRVIPEPRMIGATSVACHNTTETEHSA